MRPLRISEIKDEVARTFKIARHAIDGASREREHSTPRLVAYKLTKLHTSYSLPRIGREFGNRDHTTIISGLRSIDKLLAADPELQDRFNEINERLTQLAAANTPQEEPADV